MDKYQLDSRVKEAFVTEIKTLQEALNEQSQKIDELFDLNAREEDLEIRLAGKLAIDLQNNHHKICKQIATTMRNSVASCWELQELSVKRDNEINSRVEKIESSVKPMIEAQNAIDWNGKALAFSGSILRNLAVIGATIAALKYTGAA